MSVAIRGLAGEIHTAQIAFVRCIVSLLIILPMVLQQGSRAISTRRPKLHLLRGLLAVVGINCGFYSLTVMPLVTVTALFFTVPLFVTVLAVLVLGERVGWPRWAATAVGFSGTLVVVGFNPTGFDLNMLIALTSSLTFACALVVGKKLSLTEKPLTILFYFSVISSMGCLAPALVVWSAPNFGQLLLLLTVAVFATSRSYFDIRGYAMGEASFVAPFFYFRILFMGVAGYLLFAEVPQEHALVGAAVIMFSTLFIARREIREGRKSGVAVAG